MWLFLCIRGLLFGACFKHDRNVYDVVGVLFVVFKFTWETWCEWSFGYSMRPTSEYYSCCKSRRCTILFHLQLHAILVNVTFRFHFHCIFLCVWNDCVSERRLLTTYVCECVYNIYFHCTAFHVSTNILSFLGFFAKMLLFCIYVCIVYGFLCLISIGLIVHLHYFFFARYIGKIVLAPFINPNWLSNEHSGWVWNAQQALSRTVFSFFFSLFSLLRTNFCMLWHNYSVLSFYYSFISWMNGIWFV